jgi:hypothetical protein
MDKNFVDISKLGDYWEVKAVDRLRQAFDKLKEARDMMLHQSGNNIITPELEQKFQLVGTMLMETAKQIKSVPEEKKEDAQKN